MHGERHIVENRHMRVKRVILEHHGDVTILRVHVIDDLIVDHHVPACDALQPCDHAQKR